MAVGERDREVGSVRISVVIPTFERCELALACVKGLDYQCFEGIFEVIVVVDGSTDGTAQALRGLKPDCPLTVLEQPNRGRAAACNRGAAAARGEILLFLDDDMEADPQLLAEHDRSHRDGADVVLGHLPLHPDSPQSVLRKGVEQWAEERHQRLLSPGAEIPLDELVTGQGSIRKTVFDGAGGFDLGFTRDGSFGNEDLDLGYRLSRQGHRIVFNPRAISWQRYVVTPRQYLRQWRDAGRADVALARKHPEKAAEIFTRKGVRRWTSRWLWRPLSAVRPVSASFVAVARTFILALVERGAHDRLSTRLFFELRAAEYWRGVHDAGGIPVDRPLRILAYHSIADLAGRPVLEPYGVPPHAFEQQLDLLQKFGFHFVGADELVRFLSGRGGLPRRPVLLTFDDCYDDLLQVALPILEERRIPAIGFAVSGRMGGTNEWDEAIGAPRLRLLDATGLQELSRRGVEIGAHSHTHRLLTDLSDVELAAEIERSVAEFEAVGVHRPRFFAYPHGECDERVEQAAESAGLQAAFTVSPGRIRKDDARYRLPRIEIMRNDTGMRFLSKVFLAMRLPVGVWWEWRAKLGRLRWRLRGAWGRSGPV